MEEYKFERHAEMPDKYKGFPEAAGILSLINKFIDSVNNGHYSVQAVLNALANLYATVGTQAIVKGQIGMEEFMNCFCNIAANTYSYQMVKDNRDIENAINNIKESSNLK